MKTPFSVEQFIEKIIPKQLRDKIEISKKLRIERDIVSRIDVNVNNLFYLVLYTIQTTNKEYLTIYINRIIEDVGINLSQSKKPIILMLLLPPNIRLPDDLREWFINAIKRDLLIIYPEAIPMIEDDKIFRNILEFVESIYKKMDQNI